MSSRTHEESNYGGCCNCHFTYVINKINIKDSRKSEDNYDKGSQF